ncbi:hypothetical protein [Chryseobacterium rhizosphaerae]|uniref:hypothetical protein n=1 Tax=Chryseobacterium rhizosphaerae TaxID=395937 RepID=UPI0023591E24|nr:hypothetical protein [Chryseobacterium rhizosphaerae]MDC8098450.1 hypothetical protein [Chryseobacterium rhizosphaerae]
MIALAVIVLYLLILGFFDINTIGFICNEFFSFIAFGQNSTSLIMMGGAFLLALYLFIRSLRELDVK